MHADTPGHRHARRQPRNRTRPRRRAGLPTRLRLPSS